MRVVGSGVGVYLFIFVIEFLKGVGGVVVMGVLPRDFDFFEDFLWGLGLSFLRSDQKNKSSIGLKKCLSKIENKNLYLDLKKVRARS